MNLLKRIDLCLGVFLQYPPAKAKLVMRSRRHSLCTKWVKCGFQAVRGPPVPALCLFSSTSKGLVMLEFTNFEKRLLLTALKFFYHSGSHFVAMLPNGNSKHKKEDWEKCKQRTKKLYKQIKSSIDDGCIPEPETCRNHFRKQAELQIRLHEGRVQDLS